MHQSTFGAGLLLASVLGASAQGQGVVRGVNLGGWLVTEPWYVGTGGRDADAVINGRLQDDAFAVQFYQHCR